MNELVCTEKYGKDDKKKTEKEIFSKFFDIAFQDLGLDKWIQCEQPDILCRSGNGKTIGIEIFDYMRGPSSKKKGSIERKNESTEFEISRGLEAKILEKYSGPILCHMNFPRDISTVFKLKKITVDNYIEKLFWLAEQMIEKSRGREWDLSADELYDFRMDDYVDQFSIDQSIGNEELINVSHGIAGTVWFDEESFNEKVIQKEGKLSTYLKRCDECWILGVAHGPYISSSVVMRDIKEYRNASRFNKVILFEYPSEFKVLASSNPNLNL